MDERIVARVERSEVGLVVIVGSQTAVYIPFLDQRGLAAGYWGR